MTGAAAGLPSDIYARFRSLNTSLHSESPEKRVWVNPWMNTATRPYPSTSAGLEPRPAPCRNRPGSSATARVEPTGGRRGRFRRYRVALEGGPLAARNLGRRPNIGTIREPMVPYGTTRLPFENITIPVSDAAKRTKEREKMEQGEEQMFRNKLLAVQVLRAYTKKKQQEEAANTDKRMDDRLQNLLTSLIAGAPPGQIHLANRTGRSPSRFST